MIKYFSLESRINRLKVELAGVTARKAAAIEIQSHCTKSVYCDEIVRLTEREAQLTEKLRQLETIQDEGDS